MVPEHKDTKYKPSGNGDGPPGAPRPGEMRGAERLVLAFAMYLGVVLVLNMSRKAFQSGTSGEVLQAILLIAFPFVLWLHYHHK